MSEPLSVLPELTALWQETLNWSPSPFQQAQFQQLLTQLCELNQQVNLTRITEPEAFWEKHLWDSLWGVQPWLATDSASNAEVKAMLDENSKTTFKVIDIGTGGGFPGCPVAIAFPHWQVTLLDSTQKKVACLKTLCQELPLSNTTALCARAETLGQTLHHREIYDLALIRAVGPSPTCAEYALPFLKVGGTAVLYRGQWSHEEEQSLQRALHHSGGVLSHVYAATTPLTQGQRHCLHLEKCEVTSNRYPRSSGLPAKYPLGTVDSVNRTAHKK